MNYEEIIRDRQNLVRQYPQWLRERNRAIAALYLTRGKERGGDLSTRDIARQFGLGPTTVRQAIAAHQAEVAAALAQEDARRHLSATA